MSARMHAGFMVAILALGTTVPGGAQDVAKTQSEPEARANMARRGAGVNLGTWSLLDTPSGTGVRTSDSPLLEGYFRKGIDKHLALETTVGIWRREIETPATGGLGGSPAATTSAILLPQFTGLKLYPFTTPDDAFEPYVSAGVGFTLGFQSGSGGGALGGGGGGSGIIPGVGAGGGVGVEWRFSTAFGLAAGAHYTYIHFFQDLAGTQMYRGLGVKAGLTYRFQY